jgi:hypothetical protein
MVASAEWAGRSRFLALAYCPRTWCHHLVLDFLAVQPGVSFANQPIRGIGSGILATLAGLADSLGMGILWGEGKAGSASFYERALRIRPVRDLFVIRQGAMRSFRERYLSRMKHRLAETEWRRHDC